VTEGKVKCVVSDGARVHEAVETATGGKLGRLGEADLVACAECFWFLDAEAALASFARLLRPGGTLAIWVYGQPRFLAPCEKAAIVDEMDHVERPRRVQETFDKLGTRVCELGGAAGPDAGANVAAKNRLDNVTFPADTWAQVQRLKWISESSFLFWTETEGNEVPRISKVDETTESVQCIEGDSLLRERWTVEHVDRFLTSLLPAVTEDVVKGDGVLQHLYGELTEVMVGSWEVAVPMVMILATRK
jgi:trans-aconitate 3-methyltransferase